MTSGSGHWLPSRWNLSCSDILRFAGYHGGESSG